MKRVVVTLIATGLYSGYGRPFPGTWGTIPPLVLAYFLFGQNQVVLAVAAMLTCIISVWSSGEAEHIFGHDAKKIVIDEWAGMLITLIFVPFSMLNYVIAFVAFRAFDVIKVPPAAQLEALPRGWGVTFDDVMAGIYANLLTQLIVRVLLT